MSDDPPPPSPTYWERLGVPEPDLVGLAANPEVRLRHLALAVILLRSGAVRWDDLVETIAALGSRGTGPRLRTSITKALAGSSALVRRADGRLDVDLSSNEWHWFKLAARPIPLVPVAPPARGEPVEPAREATASAAEPSVDPDAPIPRAELGDLLSESGARTLTATAQLITALDVAGRPLGAEEASALLCQWTGKPASPYASVFTSFTSPLVRRLPDRRFEPVDPTTLSPGARAILRRARAAVRAALAAERQRRHEDARWAQVEKAAEARRRREIVEAQCAPRALLHAFEANGRILAVTLLDATERTTTTLLGDEEIGRLPTYLGGYDVLVGLGLRETLSTLGRLNAQPARLIDLAETPRTRRVRGRIVKYTTRDWLRSSLGLEDPLGDPDRMARLLARGERGPFIEQLERDAKTLFAFYRYGVIQRGVRLLGRGTDERVSVDWSEVGDGSIHGYVAELEKSGGRVEVAFAPVPRFAAPWEHSAFLLMGPRGLTVEPAKARMRLRGEVTLSDVLDARLA